MDLSHCYLHTLGPDEKVLLEELRGRIPAIVERVRQESAEAAALPRLSIWRQDVETQSEASDIVLLKYIRAEELDVDKAAERIVQTLIFRADCKIDALAEAELPDYFQGHDFISGRDPDGRPVMISRFGTMDIDKVFADVEAFVRYRAKLMENAIELLTFKAGDPEDLCQVHDYSGVMGSMYKSEVKAGVTAISKIFGEHYPEFKGKTMFVNFPAVFSKPFQAFALLLPERTRKKFVILGKDDHAALFEHLGPDLIPEGLGGLYKDSTGALNAVRGKVVQMKARAVEEVVLMETEKPVTIRWELRVCAGDIGYELLFIDPNKESTVLSTRGAENYLKAEEGILQGEFKCPGPGQVVCKFKNENAWFKGRLCVCRAGVVP